MSILFIHIKGAFKHYQKFMMIYGQVLDIPVTERHNLKNIFLIGCVNTKFFSNIDDILGPIFQDIETYNETKRSKIVVEFICGDTPMVQSIGGFIESVGNANFCCRECFIHKDQISNYL